MFIILGMPFFFLESEIFSWMVDDQRAAVGHKKLENSSGLET